MTAQNTNSNTASAVLIYEQFSDLYDSIEGSVWMSVEQRDTILNGLAVMIAQYEGIARWNVGEVSEAADG